MTGRDETRRDHGACAPPPTTKDGGSVTRFQCSSDTRKFLKVFSWRRHAAASFYLALASTLGKKL